MTTSENLIYGTEFAYNGAPPPAQDKKKKPPTRLQYKFNRIANYIKNDPLQPAAIIGAILLGTTALSSAALMPMVGAGLGVAGAALMLTKGLRNKKKMNGATLTGLALGAAAIATPFTTPLLGVGMMMAAGLYMLTRTSDTVVNNVSAIGKKFNVNPILLGVGLGIVTSLPELFVSVGSLMSGMPDIGMGNIIGSNIANIMLVLGVGTAITPSRSKGVSWKFNTAAMLGSTAIFGAQMALGVLNPVVGVGMLALLGGYMYGAYKTAIKDQKTEEAEAKKSGVSAQAASKDDGGEDEDAAEQKMSKWFNFGAGLAGVGGLVFAADILVKSASTLAIGVGIPAAVVGALAVAIGTSLPELMVTIKAAKSGKTDMAMGNVLGSNVFNALMVGGAMAAASFFTGGMAGLAVPAAFGLGSGLGLLNLGMFAGAAALCAGALAAGKGSMKKWMGYAMIGLYAAFTAGSIMLGMSGGPAMDNQINAEPVDARPAVVQMVEQGREMTAPYTIAEDGAPVIETSRFMDADTTVETDAANSNTPQLDIRRAEFRPR